MEGETYLLPGYVVRRRLWQAPAVVVELKRIAKISQPERLTSIPVSAGHGVPFLTATQAFEVRPRPRKWLARVQQDEADGLLVPSGTILITRSGTVGSAICSHGPHRHIALSDDLLRIQAMKASDLGIFYAYLRTPHARAMMRSSKYGNVIKHLECRHLEALPVPIFESELAHDIEERINRVFDLRNEAHDLALQADSAYAKAIGPVPPPENPETAFIAKASSMVCGRRRLDAYHYNPAAQAVLKALNRGAREVVTLADVTADVFMPQRFTRAYAKRGLPYLDSEPAFRINPELDKFIPAKDVPKGSDYFVEHGWILLARSGQIYGLNGSVVLATAFHENKIVSEHMIRLIPFRIRRGYLAVALGHPELGRPLILRWAFGTQIPELDPDDLRKTPVARIEDSLEGEIADRAERSAELRYQADQEESTATALVEEALCDLVGPVPEAPT